MKLKRNLREERRTKHRSSSMRSNLNFNPRSKQRARGGAGESFRLESLYSRTEYISGMPLTDGYTFGQTQINDFGRPYGEGWSTVNGFSAYATTGHLVGYV